MGKRVSCSSRDLNWSSLLQIQRTEDKKIEEWEKSQDLDFSTTISMLSYERVDIALIFPSSFLRYVPRSWRITYRCTSPTGRALQVFPQYWLSRSWTNRLGITAESRERSISIHHHPHNNNNNQEKKTKKNMGEKIKVWTQSIPHEQIKMSQRSSYLREKWEEGFGITNTT